MRTLYINAKFLSQPLTGVQRYATELMREWDQALAEGRIDPGRYSLVALAPRNVIQEVNYKCIKLVIGNAGGRLWEQFELPCRSSGSLLFSPYAAAPILKRRHLVTIHDAGVAATPEQYSFLFRTYNRFVYWALGITSACVVTVSDFSKAELHKYFAIPKSKMRVVRQGYEQILAVEPDISVLSRNGLRRQGFVLGVSSRSPIKNFDALAAAWKLLNRPDLKLVVAGGYNNRVFGSESVQKNQSGVLFLGYVSDPELRCLYENALCFVYPSSYEGFGLPPVEAMACGCPVIASNCSALPETCGDGALYCDARDSRDIAEKIRAVIDTPGLAIDLVGKGRNRVRRLSYRQCAETIWSTVLEYI